MFMAITKGKKMTKKNKKLEGLKVLEIDGKGRVGILDDNNKLIACGLCKSDKSINWTWVRKDHQ